jgi:hypothetical protein
VDVAVTVVDTTAPTLAPVASHEVLRPPDGRMVPVTIAANAHDAGGPLSLTVDVTSDQPVALDRRGAPIADFEVLGIDDAAGTVQLALRAARTRNRDRTYVVTVTATDPSGNAASAAVAVVVPHDARRRPPQHAAVDRASGLASVKRGLR